MLSLVKCINKFQDDILNQKFLIRIDCSAAKNILEKDVKNLVSKQLFARWQAQLSAFDFNIEFIKGKQNSLPDFLTREFLQALVLSPIGQFSALAGEAQDPNESDEEKSNDSGTMEDYWDSEFLKLGIKTLRITNYFLLDLQGFK